MTINIHAKEIELTDAIRSYVEEKFSSLEKFAPKILLIDVTIGMDTTHHQQGNIYMCSANVEIPGDLLRVERNAEDLYKAIDKVKDHLRETLAQRKERENSHRAASVG